MHIHSIAFTLFNTVFS